MSIKNIFFVGSFLLLGFCTLQAQRGLQVGVGAVVGQGELNSSFSSPQLTYESGELSWYGNLEGTFFFSEKLGASLGLGYGTFQSSLQANQFASSREVSASETLYLLETPDGQTQPLPYTLHDTLNGRENLSVSYLSARLGLSMQFGPGVANKGASLSFYVQPGIKVGIGTPRYQADEAQRSRGAEFEFDGLEEYEVSNLADYSGTQTGLGLVSGVTLDQNTEGELTQFSSINLAPYLQAGVNLPLGNGLHVRLGAWGEYGLNNLASGQGRPPVDNDPSKLQEYSNLGDAATEARTLRIGGYVGVYKHFYQKFRTMPVDMIQAPGNRRDLANDDPEFNASLENLRLRTLISSFAPKILRYQPEASQIRYALSATPAEIAQGLQFAQKLPPAVEAGTVSLRGSRVEVSWKIQKIQPQLRLFQQQNSQAKPQPLTTDARIELLYKGAVIGKARQRDGEKVRTAIYPIGQVGFEHIRYEVRVNAVGYQPLQAPLSLNEQGAISLTLLSNNPILEQRVPQPFGYTYDPSKVRPCEPEAEGIAVNELTGQPTPQERSKMQRLPVFHFFYFDLNQQADPQPLIKTFEDSLQSGRGDANYRFFAFLSNSRRPYTLDQKLLADQSDFKERLATLEGREADPERDAERIISALQGISDLPCPRNIAFHLYVSESFHDTHLTSFVDKLAQNLGDTWPYVRVYIHTSYGVPPSQPLRATFKYVKYVRL